MSLKLLCCATCLIGKAKVISIKLFLTGPEGTAEETVGKIETYVYILFTLRCICTTRVTFLLWKTSKLNQFVHKFLTKNKTILLFVTFEPFEHEKKHPFLLTNIDYFYNVFLLLVVNISESLHLSVVVSI